MASCVDGLRCGLVSDSDPYGDARGRWSSQRPYSLVGRYASGRSCSLLAYSTDIVANQCAQTLSVGRARVKETQVQGTSEATRTLDS